MTEKVNKSEYARRRGVTPQAINAAIRAGKITAAVDEKGMIDVALADQLYAANTHPTSGWNGHGGRRKKNTPEEIVESAKKLGIDPQNVPTLVESKTIEAAYKAKLAQLEYEEKVEKLIEVEKVKKEAFRLARVTRDAMLGIPDRVSAEIAGMTDPFAVHTKLITEIRNAIENLNADG
ncbi:MAG: hypothetical protein CGW95_01400 [Phenylobacterium zucineum]|nr:MAG: hypothetical protein CGW95_01400 [Phenylobacterium zucineum]